jgi:3-methyladenine DNA glycosylase AlkD
MYFKIIKEINSYKNNEKAKILSKFFKTGKGEYGEGDIFLGIVVPISRKIANKYIDISFEDISKLIKDKHHEIRLIAILILVSKYKRSKSLKDKKYIYNFYLKHTKYINNWDLVDLSAHYIVGDYLFNTNKNSYKILEKLAKSKNIWERRISIISTFAFIYKNESQLTFDIIKILINDKHDLIHKACGWMLREIGKRVSKKELIEFLEIYTLKIPRTMLRYAIERLPEDKRLYFLHKK